MPQHKSPNSRPIIIVWRCNKCGFTWEDFLGKKITHCDMDTTPLISALDEADRVDRICERLVKDSLEGVKHPIYCGWKGHAHADKLRGLK